MPYLLWLWLWSSLWMWLWLWCILSCFISQKYQYARVVDIVLESSVCFEWPYYNVQVLKISGGTSPPPPPSSAVPENKKLSLLRRQRWVMVNEVCMTWWWLMRQRQKLEWGLAPLADSLGVFGPSISPSHTDPIYTPFTPHLPSRSISARLFCLGNVPIELPAEEAIKS